MRQNWLKKDNMEESAEIINLSELLAKKLLSYLAQKAPNVVNKYEYYNADNEIRDFGISTPIKMTHSRPGIGWASRAVNTLSDRVVFDGFANDTFGVNDYFESINAGTVISKAKDDAFIAGCSFIAVSDDIDTGQKLLIPFTAQEATGEIDQKTGLLKYGLVVTRWVIPKPGCKCVNNIVGYGAEDYIVFTPDFTAIFESRKISTVIPNPTGRTLLHPITHRSSADRPLGKSRLTNTARRIINEVGRLKRREEIAEEFYSTPQRYINGLAEGAKKDPALDSAIGKIWAITKDEDGEKPEIGQLAQMSISQFNDAKKDKARDFCAETALTLRNLGYETENPQSAESLSAMSDDLLLEATNSQREMGEQIKQLAITVRLSLDSNNIIADELKVLMPAWKPIFQIDIGAAGDSMLKLLQVMPELQGTVASYRMLGIGIREAEELARLRIKNVSNTFMQGDAQ